MPWSLLFGFGSPNFRRAEDFALDALALPAAVFGRFPAAIHLDLPLSEGAVYGRERKILERLAENPVQASSFIVGAELHG